jgi:hypothetical protein
LKDLKKNPIRRPDPRFKLSKAARWVEEILQIPAGSIRFVRPDGQPANPDDTLASLRE